MSDDLRATLETMSGKTVTVHELTDDGITTSRAVLVCPWLTQQENDDE